MIKYCPTCFRTFDDDDVDVCPEDGTALEERATESKDPLLETVLDNRFRIDERLSEGGMGAVYRATQLSVGRQVAVKVVRPDLDVDDRFMERFNREARVIADLTHPNIVRLIDFGHDDVRDIVYLVMELVRGIELGDLLAKGRLDPALALDIVYQIGAGLTEPHSRDIVHRDLKPANVIVLPSSDGTFQVKLLDFGIARPAEPGTRLTATGAIVGTPAYLSPEQAQNEDVDQRTDLYSLGVVLFEMLTGHLPFTAPSGLQLMLKHVQRPAPRLAEAYPETIPEPLSQLVADLMEKEPGDRPSSAMEVRRRVQQLRRDLGLPSVFLDAADVAERAERIFAPWIAPELDESRLETSGSGASAPSPEREPTLRETPPSPLDETEPAADAELAFDDTLATPEPESEAPDRADAAEEAVDASAEEGESVAAGAPAAEEAPASEDEPLEADEASADEAQVPRTPAERGSRLRLTLAVVGAVAFVALVVGLAFMLVPENTDDDSEELAAIAEGGSDDAGSDEASATRGDAASPDAGASETADAAGDETDDAAEGDEEPDAGEETAVAESDDSQPSTTASDEESDPPQPGSDDGASAGQAPEIPDAGGTGAATPPSPSSGESSGSVHEGSISLEKTAQLDTLQDYDEIAGDLIIRINVGDIDRVKIPGLTRIRGNVMVDPTSTVSTVSLPDLERIDGGLMINQNKRLKTLHMPSLQVIGQNLVVTTTALETVELARLREVGTMVVASGNTQLGSLRLPNLQVVRGALSILKNDRLDKLVLPGLRSLGAELTITNSPSLRRLGLGNLKTVDAQITVTDNEAIEAIDLGALESVDGNLLVNQATALRDLELDRLRTVEELVIMNNPELSTCEMREVADRMKEDGWSGEARLFKLRDDGCS